MLLWLRQQKKNPPPEKKLDPRWVWGFLGLLLIVTSLGMWVDTHLPPEAREGLGIHRADFSHEQTMTLAVLLGAGASLVVRWRSRYGFMIRYAVYWLAIAGVFLAGYAAWWGIL